MLNNLGNIVGLIKSLVAPAKKYIFWSKIVNASFPDKTIMHEWDGAKGEWSPYGNKRVLEPIIAFGTNTPPVSPTEGDAHIVGSSPTGVFVGKSKQHAYYLAATWVFTEPKNGSSVSRASTGSKSFYIYVGDIATGAWVEHTSGAPSGTENWTTKYNATNDLVPTDELKVVGNSIEIKEKLSIPDDKILKFGGVTDPDVFFNVYFDSSDNSLRIWDNDEGVISFRLGGQELFAPSIYSHSVWLKNQNNAFTTSIHSAGSPTSSKIQYLQDKSGTIALLSDITEPTGTENFTSRYDATGKLVPTDAITTNGVVVDIKNVIKSAFYAIKNGANTFLGSMVANVTAARAFTFPDKDITVAGIDDVKNISKNSPFLELIDNAINTAITIISNWEDVAGTYIFNTNTADWVDLGNGQIQYIGSEQIEVSFVLNASRIRVSGGGTAPEMELSIAKNSIPLPQKSRNSVGGTRGSTMIIFPKITIIENDILVPIVRNITNTDDIRIEQLQLLRVN